MTLNSRWKSSKAQISASTRHPWGQLAEMLQKGGMWEEIPIGIGIHAIWECRPCPSQCPHPAHSLQRGQDAHTKPRGQWPRGQDTQICRTPHLASAGFAPITPHSLLSLPICEEAVNWIGGLYMKFPGGTDALGSSVLGIRPHQPFCLFYILGLLCKILLEEKVS